MLVLRSCALLAGSVLAAPALAQPASPAQFGDGSGASPAQRCRQAHLHARGLRPFRSEDRLRHARPGAELHHPQRRHERARARPGVGECADQRRAHRQQVGRRGRPARSVPGDQRRPDRDRRCGEPRHRRACPARSPTSSSSRRPRRRASSTGTRAFARISPSPSCSAVRSATRARPGPVDYTLSVKNNPGRGGFGGPILIYDANGSADRAAARNLPFGNREREHGGQVHLDGPGSSIGNMTLGYNPYWSPTHIRDRRELRHRRAARPRSTDHQARRLFLRLERRLRIRRSAPAG